MSIFTAILTRSAALTGLSGMDSPVAEAVAAIPLPVLENHPADPPRTPARDLQDACELIEAELDSANATCRRQSVQAAERARLVAEQVVALGRDSAEVAATALHASKDVAAVAAAGDQLSAAGREIAVQAGRSSGIARQAVAASDEAARAVTALGEAALAIGGVVKSIAAVASRTNLLALNATIEAARAGEAGRGFAVVAAEVKELSRQTAEATQDITARIRAMQEATDLSVSAMRGVSDAVRDIDAANATVAGSVGQQEATLREIAERLQTASAHTSRVAETIEQVAGRGTALGRLSEAADTDRRRSDQLLDDLRGNVCLVLRRVTTLGAEWNTQVPVMAAARLETAAWSGEVMLLELSTKAALIRLPAQAEFTVGALPQDSAMSLDVGGVGHLPAAASASSNGRMLMTLGSPEPAVAERLAHFVGRVRTEDERFLAAAQDAARRIADCLEGAIVSGSLQRAALFDSTYWPVDGSDPRQFTTSFTEAADRLVRPIIDAALSFDPNVIGTLVVDRSGYAPTHNAVVSQPQRPGDPVWNAKHCRNRRMFDDRAGLAAARNTRDCLLQSYERDMGGGERMMIKEADAPIVVGGRHWGGFRMMFRNPP